MEFKKLLFVCFTIALPFFSFGKTQLIMPTWEIKEKVHPSYPNWIFKISFEESERENQPFTYGNVTITNESTGKFLQVIDFVMQYNPDSIILIDSTHIENFFYLSDMSGDGIKDLALYHDTANFSWEVKTRYSSTNILDGRYSFYLFNSEAKLYPQEPIEFIFQTGITTTKEKLPYVEFKKEVKNEIWLYRTFIDFPNGLKDKHDSKSDNLIIDELDVPISGYIEISNDSTKKLIQIINFISYQITLKEAIKKSIINMEDYRYFSIEQWVNNNQHLQCQYWFFDPKKNKYTDNPIILECNSWNPLDSTIHEYYNEMGREGVSGIKISRMDKDFNIVMVSVVENDSFLESIQNGKDTASYFKEYFKYYYSLGEGFNSKEQYFNWKGQKSPNLYVTNKKYFIPYINYSFSVIDSAIIDSLGTIISKFTVINFVLKF